MIDNSSISDVWKQSINMHQINNFEPDDKFLKLMKLESDGEISTDMMKEMIVAKYQDKDSHND